MSFYFWDSKSLRTLNSLKTPSSSFSSISGKNGKPSVSQKNVKAYLLTSFLRKLAADWKKSGKTANLQVVHDNYTGNEPLTPEEHLIRKDEQQQLFRILVNYINELPARQKELIMLRFYEGLSYDEIVQQTGLSHRTVYNKIHEALKRLRLDITNNHNFHSASLSLIIGILISSLESV